VINIEFSDREKYCSTWLEKYTLSNAFVYLVAAGIAIVNIAVKSILRYLSKLESSHTKTDEIFSSMFKHFIV
jgi:hypothetical protein